MSLQAGFVGHYYEWWDEWNFPHYVKVADLDRAVELALLHGAHGALLHQSSLTCHRHIYWHRFCRVVEHM